MHFYLVTPYSGYESSKDEDTFKIARIFLLVLSAALAHSSLLFTNNKETRLNPINLLQIRIMD
jgi:hypothetical protein